MDNKPQPLAVLLPSAGVISVRGKDAATVVNNLTTNDVRKLEIGQSLESFVTDVRGWVVAHGVVHKLADEMLLVGQFPDPSRIVTHVDRYIVREAAIASDLTSAFELFAVSHQPPPDLASLLSFCLPAKVIGQESFIALVSRGQTVEFRQALQRTGWQIVEDMAQFESLRIRAFWPLAGREITERTLPQELDRNRDAISFTKGCYLGQETVARLDARGQLQRKLCLVEIQGNWTDQWDLVRDGKSVGTITSIEAIETGPSSRWALAFLKRGSFEVGTQLLCGSVPARVAEP